MLPKVSFSNSFSDFFNVISLNFDNFLYLQTYFCMGILHSCAGVFPKKEGGMQVLAGLAPSSWT